MSLLHCMMGHEWEAQKDEPHVCTKCHGIAIEDCQYCAGLGCDSCEDRGWVRV
jgi:DnaJ-class molecular chaperone